MRFIVLSLLEVTLINSFPRFLYERLENITAPITRRTCPMTFFTSIQCTYQCYLTNILKKSRWLITQVFVVSIVYARNIYHSCTSQLKQIAEVNHESRRQALLSSNSDHCRPVDLMNRVELAVRLKYQCLPSNIALEFALFSLIVPAEILRSTSWILECLTFDSCPSNFRGPSISQRPTSSSTSVLSNMANTSSSNEPSASAWRNELPIGGRKCHWLNHPSPAWLFSPSPWEIGHLPISARRHVSIATLEKLILLSLIYDRTRKPSRIQSGATHSPI